VSRQAYYKVLKERERKCVEEELIIQLVQQVRGTHGKMGGKKLYHLLQADIRGMDTSLGRDKFFDLLRQRDLLVKRQRKYAVTTQSFHRFKVYQNKIKDLQPKRPHQVWVCDITYIRIDKGFVYLFLITDAYSRKIVGWQLTNGLGLQGALDSLAMAIKQCPGTKSLIHH
jgi:transposase InsO family protein